VADRSARHARRAAAPWSLDGHTAHVVERR